MALNLLTSLTNPKPYSLLPAPRVGAGDDKDFPARWPLQLLRYSATLVPEPPKRL